MADCLQFASPLQDTVIYQEQERIRVNARYHAEVRKRKANPRILDAVYKEMLLMVFGRRKPRRRKKPTKR